MPAENPIARVAVPSPLYRLFDYRLPAKIDTASLQQGMRVLVPFGRQRMVGILTELVAETEVAPEKLKAVLELLDDQPVFDAHLLALVKWTAEYYHHPIGDAFATALPVLLRKPAAIKTSAQQWWSLTEAGRQLDPNDLVRAPRQAAVIAQLLNHAEGLPRQALDVPLNVLTTLKDRNWVTDYESVRPVQQARTNTPENKLPLNAHQQAAVDTVSSSLERFNAYLLEGVTGSGKTEVYLQLIETVLAQQRQVLLLVPEIGLTPQLVSRFEKRLSVPLAILHSGLTDRQRLDNWQLARSGEARVVIGTRSAGFTPLANMGLIIVDEEHDISLKQQEGFRYSARDLAVWRAHKLNIPIMLGSATPSLESLYNVAQQRYRLLSLPERAGKACMPKLHLLDIRHQPMQDMLSEPLLKQMQLHLDQGGQVLVFLNRRGFAPVLLCHDCGWHADCPRCDARMTYHRKHQQLRCHHCGHQRRVTPHCPDCGSGELIAIGQGTERMEQTLTERFPNQTVLRIDRDTTRRKGSLQTALQDATSGKAHILVGTQMLAKGHHFPAVTLVAIVDADQGLFGSDFRSSERMAQLIVQVAGRAGRGEQAGVVIIQTHQPDHPLLRQLAEQDYQAFAKAALQERCAAQFPPYTNLALLRAEATQADAPMAFLDYARHLALGLQLDIQLWGPLPAPMERRAGRYRAQLMFQASQRRELHQLLDVLIPQFEGSKLARKVRWSIDVDPQDML